MNHKNRGAMLYLTGNLENAIKIYGDLILLNIYLNKYHPGEKTVDLEKMWKDIFNTISLIEHALNLTQEKVFNTYQEWQQAMPEELDESCLKIYTIKSCMRYVLALDNKHYPQDLKDYNHLESCHDQ